MSKLPPEPTVWPCLRFADAPAAVRMLVDVFGFTEALVVPDDDGDIVHAELRWPEGGAVMLGSAKRKVGGTHDKMLPGVTAVYVVTDHVDAVYARAKAAGLEISEDLHDTEYASHTFTACDAEGNMWTFGTYRGA